MGNSDAYPDLDDEQLTRIDLVCEQFERSLRSSAPGSIADHLTLGPESLRQALFAELLAIELEFKGKHDFSLDIDEYRARYQDFPQVIENAFRLRDAEAIEAHSEPSSQESAFQDDLVGTQIGRFKLRELIGEGGMGRVYVAEQDTPVRRTVALKIVKPGMDSREVLARFEAERQALALMDHAHIAQVLDAGITPAERPYFVMELIRGLPVTHFCDKHALSTRARLELFVQICLAVQHAHQRGIIHRDIKPTNILVKMEGDEPVPKVIDFGVAKAVNQRLTDSTVYTRVTQLVGTPVYMSPEQADLATEDIDTRTDIYSLGVVLYELLTGTTPVPQERLSSAGQEEMRRIIREEEPPRPNQRLSTLDVDAASTVSKQRGVDHPKLVGMMRGELDWIAMKAMSKERVRRYETPSEFAADVRRFLADEAVLACPPSWSYQLGKFARRHKLAITTATCVLIALITSILALAISNRVIATQREVAERQRKRADENFLQAREAVDRFFTLVSETTLLDAPGLQLLRRELIENAVGFYQSWIDRGDAPIEVVIELANIRLRLSVLHYRLTSSEECVAELERAFALIDQVLTQRPAEAQEFRALAGFYPGYRAAPGTFATLTSERRVKAAFERGRELWRRFARAHTSVLAFRRDLAFFTDSEAELRALVDEFPRDAELQALLALSKLHHGRLQEDPSLMRQGIGKLEEANLPVYRGRLASAYQNLGWLLMSQRKHAEAAKELKKSVALYHELANQFSHVADYEFRAREYTSDLARALAGSGQLAEAEQLAAEVTPRTGSDYMLRGDIFREIGQVDKAVAEYERALYVGLKGNVPNVRRAGEFFASKEQHEQAVRFYDHDILTNPSPSVSRTYAVRGASRVHLGEYDKAIIDFTAAIETNAWDCEHHLRQVTLRMLQASPEGFRTAFLRVSDRAIELTEESATSYHARARVYLGLGKRELARGDIAKGIQMDPDFKIPWDLRPLLGEPSR